MYIKKGRYTVKIVDGKKPCCTCKEHLPIEEFNVDVSRPTGLASACRQCTIKKQKLVFDNRTEETKKRSKEKAKIYYNNHREKYIADAKKNREELTESGFSKGKARDIRKYGITPERYNEMYEEQQGCCAICKKPETSRVWGTKKSLSIDHDHDTEEVRGLLCTTCNNGLGCFKDKIELMKDAINYLEKYKINKDE